MPVAQGGDGAGDHRFPRAGPPVGLRPRSRDPGGAVGQALGAEKELSKFGNRVGLHPLVPRRLTLARKELLEDGFRRSLRGELPGYFLQIEQVFGGKIFLPLGQLWLIPARLRLIAAEW